MGSKDLLSFICEGVGGFSDHPASLRLVVQGVSGEDLGVDIVDRGCTAQGLGSTWAQENEGALPFRVSGFLGAELVDCRIAMSLHLGHGRKPCEL